MTRGASNKRKQNKQLCKWSTIRWSLQGQSESPFWFLLPNFVSRGTTLWVTWTCLEDWFPSGGRSRNLPRSWRCLWYVLAVIPSVTRAICRWKSGKFRCCTWGFWPSPRTCRKSLFHSLLSLLKTNDTKWWCQNSSRATERWLKSSQCSFAPLLALN